jgi:hypothetical protein
VNQRQGSPKKKFRSCAHACSYTRLLSVLGESRISSLARAPRLALVRTLRSIAASSVAIMSIGRTRNDGNSGITGASPSTIVKDISALFESTSFVGTKPLGSRCKTEDPEPMTLKLMVATVPLPFTPVGMLKRRLYSATTPKVAL